MKPHYADDAVTLYAGDCLDVLPTLPDNSVDAVVTDPPYGLEFMGKDWDRFRADHTTYRWHGEGLAVASGDASQAGADEMADRLQALPSLTYKANLKCRTCGSWQRARPQNKCVCPTPDFEPRRNDRNLGFQQWCQLWAAECLRVLKPGGHLLAFGGTRTWHRLAVAIEDAGFEIRDTIAWMYGSGFPKSLDVSKAIDRARDDRDHVLAVTRAIRELRDQAGKSNRDLDALFGFAGMAGHWTTIESQPTVPTVEQWATLRDVLNAPGWLDAEVWRLNGRKGTPGEAWQTAELLAVDERWNEPSGVVNVGQGERTPVTRQIKAANSADAQRWQGWGTALKPAHEPIVVARKPLTGTVAANVQRWGTGALNIDGCRIGTDDDLNGGRYRGNKQGDDGHTYGSGINKHSSLDYEQPAGRWPANVALDETAAAALDEQSGESTSPLGMVKGQSRSAGIMGKADGHHETLTGYGDMGGASRFFYTAKAGSDERITYTKPGGGFGNQNYGGYKVHCCDDCGRRFLATVDRCPKCDSASWHWEEPLDRKPDTVSHPTVKPLSLMRWLVRLVCPPGGTILEPFAGSGTTVEAAILEGFRCIAIEREPDYLPLITQRLNRRRDPVAYLTAAGEDLGLFDEDEPA